MDIYIATEIWK